MRRRRVVAVVGVAMMIVVMTLAVGMGVSHRKMLYYNIAGVHGRPGPAAALSRLGSSLRIYGLLGTVLVKSHLATVTVRNRVVPWSPDHLHEHAAPGPF
jgi:hypothetical protein